MILSSLIPVVLWHPAIADEGSLNRGVLRSKHLIYGIPRYKDKRFDISDDEKIKKPAESISILVREGFILGHCDKYKNPSWVSVRWTYDDLVSSEKEKKFGRPFVPDSELPTYAQALTAFNGNRTLMDRGHMARHKDNSAWGQDSSRAGCLMSNISPQHKDLNRKAWLTMEDFSRFMVEDRDPNEIWVISGPVFKDNHQKKTVANEVEVPDGFYKIIAWFDEGKLDARGFYFPNDNSSKPARGTKKRDKLLALNNFMKSIDTIENLTGLDFFPELPEPEQSNLEKKDPPKDIDSFLPENDT